MTTTPAAHSLIQGSLSQFDPYRVDAAIKLDPSSFVGASLNVGASVRAPSIGLAAPSHPLVHNSLAQLSDAKFQDVFHLGTALKSTVIGGNTGGAKTATEFSNLEDTFSAAGCFSVHGVLRNQMFRVDTAAPLDHGYITQGAIALSVMPQVWDCLAPHSRTTITHSSTRYAADLDDEQIRDASLLPGLIATGAPITLRDIKRDTDHSSMHDSLLGRFKENMKLTDDVAEVATDHTWQILSDLTHEHTFIASRATHLARLILGMYDFYGIKHDTAHPYLVEPSIAASKGFTPTKETSTFPNPLFVPIQAIKDSVLLTLPIFSNAPTLSPTYEHPKESVDYGRIPGGDECAYMLKSANDPALRRSWAFCASGTQSGEGDVDFQADKEAHLHHVAWGPSSPVDAAHAASRPPTKDECGMLIQGFLPADQLRECCTLSLHNSDLGVLEAARFMNPKAWQAVAKMTGVDPILGERLEVMTKALLGDVDADISCLEEPEREVFAAMLDTMSMRDIPKEILDDIEDYTDAKRISELRLVCTQAHVQAAQDLLSDVVRAHATNILERHPVLLHPAVVMPMVRTNRTIAVDRRQDPLAHRINRQRDVAQPLVVRKELTTTPMNLALGNISLPVNSVFANNEHVILGLGDRSPQYLVNEDRGPRSPEALDQVDGFIDGLPTFTPGAGGQNYSPDSARPYLGLERSQVACVMRELTSRKYFPTGFYASVLELNTHTDEFILYRDQLIEHLSDFDPRTGAHSYPAPTANPFLIGGRIIYEGSIIPSRDASQHAESFYASLSQAIDDPNTQLSIKVEPPPLPNVVSNIISRQVYSQLGNVLKRDAINACTTPLASTAPVDPVRLLPPEPGLLEQWIIANDTAPLPPLSSLPFNQGLTSSYACNHPLVARKNTPRALAAPAGSLRLLRALRSHTRAGACIQHEYFTPFLVSDAWTTLFEDYGPPVISAVHYMGATKTKTGAARLAAANNLFSPFTYNHQIDGINLQAEAPLMANALNQAFDAGLAMAHASNSAMDGCSFVASNQILQDLGHPTTPPNMSALIAHAKQHAPGQPNTLIFPMIASADHLPAGPTQPNPLAGLEEHTRDPRSYIGGHSMGWAGPLCGVAAGNNMTMHGVGQLFFGPSSISSDKKFCALISGLDAERKPGALVFKDREADPFDSDNQDSGAPSDSTLRAIATLDEIFIANQHEAARAGIPLPQPGTGSIPSPFIAMTDMRAVATSPCVDDLFSVNETLRGFGGAEQGVDGVNPGLPASVVRIGAIFDSNKGATPQFILKERQRIEMLNSLNQLPSQTPPPKARTRRV